MKNKSSIGNRYSAEFAEHNYTNALDTNGIYDHKETAKTLIGILIKIRKVQRKHHYPIIDIRYRNFKHGSEKPKPDKAKFICQRRI